MRKGAWVGLWAVSISAAFAVGVCIPKPRRPMSAPPQQAAKTASRKPETDRAILATLQRFRTAPFEKEQVAFNVKSEIADVRTKLPPSLTPEDERLRKKWPE